MKSFMIAFMMLFCTVNLNAQVDSIKLVYPGILTEVNFKVNTSSNISYQRTLSWINETYKNPDKVLVGKIEGKSVTVSGFIENAFRIDGIVPQYYDISYTLYLTILDDNLINYNMVVEKSYFKNKPTISGLSGLFNNKGEYKLKVMNVAKSTMEKTANELLSSYLNKMNSIGMSSEEAITELKKYKEKLDLELISQKDYDAKKAELSKYIK